MSPKSLLRHKLASSTLEDFSEGQFLNVIPEIDNLDPLLIKRLIVCGGKVYYDLLDERRKNNLINVAIIRIEQLYPFPDSEMFSAISNFSNLENVIWCQEEPKNQGAWYHTHHRLRRVLDMLNMDLNLEFIGRKSSASPAVGYMSLHLKQQKELVYSALGLTLD